MAFNLGGMFQGGLGGAATGFGLGGGPIGAIGGGLLGGLMGGFGGGPTQQQYGLPGFDERQRMLQQQIGNYSGPQLGAMQTASMGGPFRAGQIELMGQLQEQAAGRGPSLANRQFDRSLQQGMNAQLAAAQTGQGNAALAARNAAANIGTMSQDLAGQAAQARIQEQLLARQQLAGLTGQGRAQEMQGSQFNAGQSNQRDLAFAQMMQNYNMGLRDLELRNAQLQQAGMMGYGQQAGPGMGTQLLGGGGALLSSYFANKQRNPHRPGTYSDMGFWVPGSREEADEVD